MTGKQKILLISLVAAHLLILLFGMNYRFVDADEGGMLIVSKEVIGGSVPVIDINAHNQPLMYYFYGAWMKMFGFNIVAARSLSILCVFIAGLLLFLWVYRFSGNYLCSLVLYFLFITNLTYFKSTIPVKPFALSNLFIFASFVLLTLKYRADDKLSGLTLFLSGLLLGISLGVRLIFILPVIYMLWILWVLFKNRLKITEVVTKTAVFAVGLSLPLLPSVWIFIKEPLRAYTIWAGVNAQVFLGKGNNPDFAVDVIKDIKSDLMLQGLKDVITVPDNAFLIFLILLSSVILLFGWRRIEGRKKDIYIFIWLIFGSVIWVYSHLFLNYVGYVNQVVLFAIMLALPLAEEAARRVNPKKFFLYAFVFLFAIGAFYYQHFQKRLKTSIFYFMDSQEQVITPGYVDRISEDIIKKLTKKEDTVLDTWGVFVFASGRKPVKGFEYPTDNALFWELMHKKENAGKYLYISEPEMFGKIERKEIPLVILGDDKELRDLVYDKRVLKKGGGLDVFGAHMERLRSQVEKSYRLYAKYFVKPTNAWILIYVPKE